MLAPYSRWVRSIDSISYHDIVADALSSLACYGPAATSSLLSRSLSAPLLRCPHRGFHVPLDGYPCSSWPSPYLCFPTVLATLPVTFVLGLRLLHSQRRRVNIGNILMSETPMVIIFTFILDALMSYIPWWCWSDGSIFMSVVLTRPLLFVGYSFTVRNYIHVLLGSAERTSAFLALCFFFLLLYYNAQGYAFCNALCNIFDFWEWSSSSLALTDILFIWVRTSMRMRIW